MNQTIYGAVYDCGDGSSNMHWFRNADLVKRLLKEDQSYWVNERRQAETLTFPADLDLEKCGFVFSDDDER